MNKEKQIRIYALDNAVKYEGQCSRGAIIGQVLNAYPDWKKDMKELQPIIGKVMAEVNAMGLQEQIAMLQEMAPEMLAPKEKKVKEALKDLARAEVGKVVLRFEPSPSGSMHIGHSYPGSINSLYAHKYEGKVILRIADTNPDNIDVDAYDLLKEDMEWLHEGPVEYVVQSERMESYYSVMLKLLQDGNAYVCECDPEEFRELITKQMACPCRAKGPTEQVARWHKMHDGGYAAGDVVARLKTDLRHKNPALRDFSLARINESEHPKQGTKYRVWPLMNLAVATDDYELGLTHVIRGKDHLDNMRRQVYIYDFMGWEKPEFIHTGRINFEGLKLSASGMRQDIDAGIYSGWDDIQLPTLQAMKRRGYQAKAFREFAKSQGLTMVDKRVAKGEFYKSLNAFNRQIIEPTSYRYFFVANPKEITVEGAPEQKIALHLHPDHKHGGRELVSGEQFYIEPTDLDAMEEGSVYRLMDSLNMKKEDGQYVFVDTDLATYRNGGKGIFHWLPVSEDLVDVDLMMDDGSVVSGKGEGALAALEEGTIVQFERKGFAKFDHKEEDRLVFWWTHN